PDGRIQNQSIVTEVTAIKQREECMTLLAQTDQLTGLSNKATFARLAQTTLTRHSDCTHALLMLDIDGFKGINDSYGHSFGDQVLAAVARQLKEIFRSSDLIGRVGGDEFMVLMTDLSPDTEALGKTEALCRAIRGIQFESRAHPAITVSIGVSLFFGGKTFDSLSAEADEALYHAKENGKNQYVFAPVSLDAQKEQTAQP
ncbi:MAG: GGDEF domain-containing protein, partial [Oscillospiraceae bacterium]